MVVKCVPSKHQHVEDRRNRCGKRLYSELLFSFSNIAVWHIDCSYAQLKGFTKLQLLRRQTVSSAPMGREESWDRRILRARAQNTILKDATHFFTLMIHCCLEVCVKIHILSETGIASWEMTERRIRVRSTQCPQPSILLPVLSAGKMPPLGRHPHSGVHGAGSPTSLRPLTPHWPQP